jgi:hypothetical protein
MSNVAAEATDTIELLALLGIIGGIIFVVYEFETSFIGDAISGTFSGFEGLFNAIGISFSGLF